MAEKQVCGREPEEEMMMLQEDKHGPDLLSNDKDSELVCSHFFHNIIALRSSVSLPTSLCSFPYNIHCPAHLCLPLFYSSE